VEQDLLIGIDSGTQSVRVIVFNTSGQVIAFGSAKHSSCSILQNGGVEQDPEDIWRCFCKACREALANLPFSPDRISACSITSQRSTMIAVDKAGVPLRPAFSWMDQRKNKTISTSLPNNLKEIQEGAKSYWMKLNEPHLYQAIYKVLSVSGWLTQKLCGNFHDSEGNVAGIWPFDIKRLAWSTDMQLYEAFGIPPEKLPYIFPPGSLLGKVTLDAEEQTGLPVGLPILAGSGDKMCEMLGAGAIKPEQGYITYGSMAGLEVNTPAPLFAPAGEYWTNPAAIPGKWSLEFAVQRGYLMLSWFCRQFDLQGGTNDLSGEKILDQEAMAVPAGSDGLVIAPYWSPTGIAPGARSVVLGLDDRHSRAHLYRAILEGTAYALRQGMNRIVEDTRQPLSEIVSGGGGARSDLVMQITADVLGLPVWRIQTIDTCSLGTAIIAAVGIGIYETYNEAVDHMIKRQDCFKPHPGRQALYSEIFHGIYEGIYPSLKNVYKNYNHVFESTREESPK
jgi:sugar (pentulose or hexulose) kinase